MFDTIHSVKSTGSKPDLDFSTASSRIQGSSATEGQYSTSSGGEIRRRLLSNGLASHVASRRLNKWSWMSATKLLGGRLLVTARKRQDQSGPGPGIRFGERS